MRVRPVSPSALVDHVVALVLAGEGRRRVLVDGAAPLAPGNLADALVEPLRAAGRAVARVHADDFLRPASVRYELGREDPDAYLEDRLDAGALAREVLDPFAAEGRYLPSLWDAGRDRATRAPYAAAPERAVLVVDGELLLGRWFDAELTVHLTVRPATLARRLGDERAWQLPAFARYEDEVAPQDVADVVARVDDPRHPALVER
ncbi:uridine kinase [Cellulomonas shaoxiangyii]|uniref:Uridine kinase n=1 Tax=Cellulomonas shaoxiangyii TaxID=2566013 RepID=A0A4P7SLS8_9CELL|nr:uridine kinase [Cellulomonas shaoxiangyii]QCB94146.1 uridine kinase [Cellulomonas shaoxiangyii]TGY86639.1 uridine kinase [Cellulomonas shaoxiangyii]